MGENTFRSVDQCNAQFVGTLDHVGITQRTGGSDDRFDTCGGEGDYVHNADEWDYNLKSLTNYQEQIGTKTQTLMVYLQDFIGQYNSYMQGANTQISNANQTLTNIARGQ